ncbi:uncharacterized protein LOC115239328 [Formica exsecta]|uniref:uncharacterized protein LOC115239328 n=1 Tax=Formica exsecta TaxID=72781 RepID=UPI001141E1C9|nr:uncharacterized protein LOC115239328 [Formica exsecta]
MRLYAVALVIWAATITAFSEPNVGNLSEEKAVDYTEPHDLPEKQIARFYVTGTEARSSGQTDTGDHPDAGSSGWAARADEKDSNGVSASDSSTPEPIYATPLAETIDEYPFKELSRESGYTVPEEILLVENAGSFGQRLRQDHPSGRTIVGNTVRTVSDDRKDDDYASIRKSFSNTASPLEDESDRAYASVTSEPYVFALKKGSDSADDLPPSNNSEVIESKASSTEEIFHVETATEISSTPAEIDVTSILGENDVVPEDHQTPRARLSRAYNDTANEATEKPMESEKSVVRVSSSTSVEISPSLQPVKFSGPIVVPDLTDRETSEMTVDYLDDSEAGAFRSVENVEITGSYAEGSRPAASNGIKTSSIMLNPLQVGIALVNAGEIGSMDDSEQSAATNTKDYLQDYLQDDLQRLSTVDKKFVESDIENRSRVDYKDESFQREREGERSSIEAITQKVPENSVEIQKSVELYHTAPVHEIHYPPIYIQQTSNLGVIETNNIGRSNQPYGQDEQSESRSNYNVYRGNEQSVERSVIKPHASEQKLTRHQYNALEDDHGKPTASSVIAEYTSSPEQAPVEYQPYKYNDVQPVLLVPNQFDDTSYDQSNVRHSFKDNGNASPHAVKFLTYAGTTRQESASETYRSEQQQQQQQPPQLPQSSQQPAIDHQFRTPYVRRPEETQLLLKIIPDGSSAKDAFVVPIPRPYPTIEKIIEKTVHVPHPIEIEKVIERKVPFPVERVVEKRLQVPVPVAVPQLYPVHVQMPMVEKQIRVPHIYPIHVERLIERRVPYAVQRLLVQPAPYPSLQLRLPEKPTEKPIATPARLSPASRPYRTDAERPVDSGGSSDTSKLNDIQSKHRQKASATPRGSGDSAAFEPQSETNASQLSHSIPPYGRPLMYDYNIDVGKGYVPFTDVKLMILPRKYNSHVVLRPQAVSSSTYAAVPFRQQIVYNLVERPKASKDDEYLGPAPPRINFNLSSQCSLQPSATTTALRRSRQPETQVYPGSFRQSKMEYGFKPPMVPSVQYDELTATQVEN